MTSTTDGPAGSTPAAGPLPSSGQLDPLYAARLHLVDGLPVPSLLAPPDTPEQAERRAAWDAPFGPAELPEVRAWDASVEGPHGPVPIRVYRPIRDAVGLRPALLWLHGGAWVFGDLEMPEGDHTARRVADLADAVVVAVDYRLALGGVHYPVPNDDCWAVYQWLREQARELGVDVRRIAVGGASAGGALAGSVILRGVDAGISPWQALLVYPACHADVPTHISDELMATLARTPEALLFGHDESFTLNYLGGPIASATGDAFPSLAESLADFPPTYIENAEFDSLRASGEAFAAQLTAAGVEVELVTACGVPHGHLNDVGLPQAVQTCERLARRLTAPAAS